MISDASLGEITIPVQKKRFEIIRQKLPLSTIVFMIFTLLGASLLILYFVIRNLALFAPGYSATDRIASVILLASEIYISFQGIGFYIQTIHSLRTINVSRITRLAPMTDPLVAIYIATYNEPADVIKNTVTAISLLQYPNKIIYINCDHQSEEQAQKVREIAENAHVNFIHRKPNTGYKAGGINEFLFRLGKDLPAAPYLCVFDADSIPQPSFLHELMPYFEDDIRIAYVQAPQSYSNAAESYVAAASAAQQESFGHYISEGKQANEAMFYCGTNVIFRCDALRDIGGLLIESITEDFNTSIALHARGWKSQYCNTGYVSGLGPTDLRAFWTQQGRWALGNLESFRMSAGKLFFRFGLTFAQRWEYTLSGTYFLVGVNTIIVMTMPALYLLFGVRPLILSPLLYAVTYVPHFIFSNWFYFVTLGKRGLSKKTLFLSQCLTTITFPTYTAATIAAFLGQKKAFAVTPKGAGSTLKFTEIKSQIGMMIFLGIASVTGIIRIFYTLNYIIIINLVWCLYHILLLSTVFYFQRSHINQTDLQSVYTTRYQPENQQTKRLAA